MSPVARARTWRDEGPSPATVALVAALAEADAAGPVHGPVFAPAGTAAPIFVEDDRVEWAPLYETVRPHGTVEAVEWSSASWDRGWKYRVRITDDGAARANRRSTHRVDTIVTAREAELTLRPGA